MKSHQADFNPRDALQFIAAPTLAAAACAILLHAAAWAGILPAPRPTLDTDRTILIHQADAARHGPQADVLLIGDSSCLMDTSARQLSASLNRSVLNLGTLSHLDLGAYALLLREHTRRHTPKAVVLLMHAEALRRLGPEGHPLSVLTNYLAGRDDSRTARLSDAFNFYSGADIANGRLLARLLPSPLRGTYGAYYGFSHDLERHLDLNLGSAVDSGLEKFSGNAEYRLAPTLDKASLTFHAELPEGVRLFVGVTPAPAGFVRDGFAAQRDVLLRQWAEWLSADAALTDLPATLPDDQFARVTHLRPAAVPAYTETLARAIRPLLP